MIPFLLDHPSLLLLLGTLLIGAGTALGYLAWSLHGDPAARHAGYHAGLAEGARAERERAATEQMEREIRQHQQPYRCVRPATPPDDTQQFNQHLTRVIPAQRTGGSR